MAQRRNIMSNSKSQNRKDFPLCAIIIDQCRKAFGNVKVQFISEKGKSLGTEIKFKNWKK